MRTLADGAVRAHFAEGVDAASVSLVARVSAAAAEAHLGGGALVVGGARSCKLKKQNVTVPGSNSPELQII